MQYPHWSVPPVAMADYAYDLPESRIAAFPLEERDGSRLLVARARSGTIDHRHFADLPSLLPAGALLVVNDTRVVRARIVMHKPTGGRVELFLLEPLAPSHDPAVALATTSQSTWRCLIGGARKLRAIGAIEERFDDITVRAEIVGEDAEGFHVRFAWSGALSLAEILERAGRVPLPPYIRRDADERDAETYQTVYAEPIGSVAAPTAGLHFTPRVLAALHARGVDLARVTLHVGAGTFRQVKGASASEHAMHGERIAVDAAALARLIDQARRRRDAPDSPIVLVGTTSLRTVESLYWFGARLVAGEVEDGSEELSVEQWDPYRLEATRGELPGLADALEAVERWRGDRARVEGTTRIMIVPGYRFRACDALVTNFHQPQSTLVLLVAALLGRELWRRVYDEALAQGYRFLSYGDSSILIADESRFAPDDQKSRR